MDIIHTAIIMDMIIGIHIHTIIITGIVHITIIRIITIIIIIVRIITTIVVIHTMVLVITTTTNRMDLDMLIARLYQAIIAQQ